MWGESKQASSATMAVAYVTVGAILDVWSVIWFIYLIRHGATDGVFLVCYGLFFTGLVLMGIGLLVGRIGKASLDAEVSPTTPVVASPVVNPQATTPVTTPATTATPVSANGTPPVVHVHSR